MKLISFSLYNNVPKYALGAIANVHLAKRFYPEWNTIFYVGNSVKQDTLKSLTDLGARIIREESTENNLSMLWRYKAIDIENTTFCIFRDCDSRISLRESEMVRKWLESGSDLHIIRDHPFHNRWIMGGMFGVNSNQFKGISALVSTSKIRDSYNSDQYFIYKNIYLKSKSRFVHDDFYWRNIFRDRLEIPRNNFEFVGEPFDEQNLPNPYFREVLSEYEKNQFKKLILRIKDLAIVKIVDLIYNVYYRIG